MSQITQEEIDRIKPVSQITQEEIDRIKPLREKTVYDARFPGVDASQQCWQYMADWKKCESLYDEHHPPCQFWRRQAHKICPGKFIEKVTVHKAFPAKYGQKKPEEE